MDMTTRFLHRFHPAFARTALVLALALAGAGAAAAQALEPGQFEWIAPEASTGPLLVLASIPEQRVHVYRNGARIGVSTISTGRPGHETPTGVYPILEKRRTHRSNLYDNAPMPYMQRLSWDGVALHAGRIPGYPASHGCIRLPAAFAAKLFELTERGTLVVVADEVSHGPDVLYPGERAPVDMYSGLPLQGDALVLSDAVAAPAYASD